jgi:hypothetical protein
MRFPPKCLMPVTVLLMLAACAPVTTPPLRVQDMLPTGPQAGTAASEPTLPASAPSTPEPTAIPVPTSLNLDGPYVLFEGEDGIWITNPDGSFLTRLYDSGVGAADLHRAISPQGDALAFISESQHGPLLVLLSLPDGAAQVAATLQTVLLDDIVSEPLSAQAFAYYAITKYDNVAWQPGAARYVAFVGAIDGPTSDLYVYDRQTEEIAQLTDGGSQALYPTWSPDGAYVLHFGGRWTPPFGGAIVGYNQADGAWAVRLADGKVITQPAGVKWPWNLVGWLDAAHYLASEDDEACDTRNLLTVAAGEGEAATTFAGCFASYAALSPANGAVLISSTDCEACPLGEGTFLLMTGESAPQEILAQQSWGIDWFSESGAFHAYPNGLVSSEGKRLSIPPVADASFHPALSTQGFEAWEVIENQQGRVVVRSPGGEYETILEAAVAAMIWDPLAGTTLLIASQDGVLYAASAPDFEPRPVGDLGSRVNQAIWVP